MNKAGRASEAGRLGVKLLKELKRDIETAIVGAQGSSGGQGGAQGGTATARSSAGMEAWIGNGTTTTTQGEASNVVVCTTTSDTATSPGFASGAVTAPTDGTTTGALTEGQLKAALEGAWSDGGDPSVILVGSRQKKVIDAFSGIATRFVDSAPNKQASIVGAANMYVSSFGTHTIVMSRYVRASVVLCIDPEYWAVAFLRPFKKIALARTGEAEKALITSEWTLVCRNNAANAKVVGCA